MNDRERIRHNEAIRYAARNVFTEDIYDGDFDDPVDQENLIRLAIHSYNSYMYPEIQSAEYLNSLPESTMIQNSKGLIWSLDNPSYESLQDRWTHLGHGNPVFNPNHTPFNVLKWGP